MTSFPKLSGATLNSGEKDKDSKKILKQGLRVYSWLWYFVTITALVSHIPRRLFLFVCLPILHESWGHCVTCRQSPAALICSSQGERPNSSLGPRMRSCGTELTPPWHILSSSLWDLHCCFWETTRTPKRQANSSHTNVKSNLAKSLQILQPHYTKLFTVLKM